MKNCVIAAILIIIFGYFSLSYFLDYRNEKEFIAQYDQLLVNPDSTIAHYNEEYTAISFKGIKTYKWGYRFSINNKNYEKTIYRESEPLFISDPLVKVYFLKEDPRINSINPKAEITEVRRKNSLRWSVGLGVAALILVLSFTFHYKKYKLTRR